MNALSDWCTSSCFCWMLVANCSPRNWGVNSSAIPSLLPATVNHHCQRLLFLSTYVYSLFALPEIYVSILFYSIFIGCSPVQPGTPLCLCSSSACSHPYYVLCSLSAAILVLSTTVLTACSPVLPAAIFTPFFPVLPCFLLKSCFFVDFKCFHVTDWFTKFNNLHH